MTRPIVTADASHTLFSDRFNEHYHSIHGAIQESNHIFIESCLKKCDLKEISILEVGFGTGLNALLTYLQVESQNITIKYTALELYPLAKERIEELNYPQILGSPRVFHQMHDAAWEEWVSVYPSFMIKKLKADLTSVQLREKYDVIYFDAFSPEVQPEMWEEKVFKNLIKHCNPKAILTTYSAKGAVRRALQSVGFEVERIPGPPGKREMLRAQLP